MSARFFVCTSKQYPPAGRRIACGRTVYPTIEAAREAAQALLAHGKDDHAEIRRQHDGPHSSRCAGENTLVEEVRR